MALTKIEWTATVRPDGTMAPGFTFNPWRGCTKISPGCTNCYAETMSHRNPSVLGVWGDKGSRVVAAESYWSQPMKWDRQAKEAGERRRVFCASLADVFEGVETMPAASVAAVSAARRRLFKLIRDTPNLDWLLLTKRPQNVLPLTRRAIDPFDDPDTDCNAAGEPNGLEVAAFGELYPNVWLGVSVEDQRAADERIPVLLTIPAAVRFLSCEPLLGPILLRAVPGLNKLPAVHTAEGRGPAGIDWVIVGGESGHGARTFDLGWARSLRDQCRSAGVAFFMKQMGAAPHEDGTLSAQHVEHRTESSRISMTLAEATFERSGWLQDKKGGDPDEWPEDLCLREFPSR